MLSLHLIFIQSCAGKKLVYRLEEVIDQGKIIVDLQSKVSIKNIFGG